MKIAISRGTLVINTHGETLLCHVTGTNHWDLPKGLLDPGESTLIAVQRALFEETGLTFDISEFEELGRYSYRPNKQLHLYRVVAPVDLENLDHLVCTSHFPHYVTGKPSPEMDGFR